MDRRQFIKTGVAGTASLGVPRVAAGEGLPQASSSITSSSPLKASLNGLELTLDSETGGLLEMAYPGPGKILETSPERAGLVDLAYPVTEFEPLRLASRFSKDAKVSVSNREVVIRIENLGASRDVKVAGKVSATVRLVADSDGRSVIMTCEIDNQSNKPVRQVVFPDLFGIVPLAGEEFTEFRTAGFRSQPFKELRLPERADAGFYYDPAFMREYASGRIEYRGRGMILRWMDVGSLGGGFSLFQKRWLWDPKEDPERETHHEHVMLQVSEIDQKLRLMCLHKVGVVQGQKWKSKEYVLTPHKYGWAEGIEPFRQWVKQTSKREYPLPKHVREGLGFRTILMSQQYGMNPVSRSGVYKFTDLPAVAKEAKEHGLDEICAWHWYWSFQSPLPGPFTVVGRETEMTENTAACKKLGVNVQYFITCMTMASPSAQSYGMSPDGGHGNWTYHTDFVPRFQPEYGVARWGKFVNQSNRRWQADVLNSCKHLVDIGCASIGWDQFMGNASVEPNLYTLCSQIRAYAKQRDRESTFSGENGTEMERDAIYVDYNWNHLDYGDFRPFTSVMATPRLDPNIDRSVPDVKLCFMDNLYMCIMPTKPEGVTGSARIADFPELSRTLKQCARLRKQFLDHFLEGKLVGECILSEPCPGSHVTAYVRPGRALMLLMNMGEARNEPQSFQFSCDLAHWVPTASGGYEIRAYDIDGRLLRTQQVSSEQWRSETDPLAKYDLVVYEILERGGS